MTSAGDPPEGRPPVIRVSFLAGDSGDWQVETVRAVPGDGAADAGAFDELVGRLRETPEWRYVAREVEIRVRRA